MTKEQLRMQILSGVITENEYKLRLNEQTDTDFIKSEMERHIGLVTNNPDISDQEKKRRIDNIKFVVYDFFDPNTNGGKRPSSDFQFDDNWWNSILPDIDKFVIDDAATDLVRASKGDSFGENDIPLNEKNFLNELINYKMNKEQLRMQMLAGVITEGEYKAKLEEIKSTENKDSLNEHFVAGGIVGIGAINQIPSRAKEVYEDAFEHFLKERYETKFENREQDVNEEMGDGMEKEELITKIKNLGDFGLTGDEINFKGLLITSSTQEDEGGPYYFVYGEDDESEDGIFSSTSPEEVAEFVLNY